MLDDNNYLSRRSAVKILSGLTAGTALGSGSVSADQGTTMATDEKGHSKWVLRFPNIFEETDDAELSPTEAKQVGATFKRDALNTLSARPGYEVKSDFWLANAVLVTTQTEPAVAQRELSGLSGVQEVHPDFEIPGPEPISDSKLTPYDHGLYQYGLSEINVPAVWDQFGTRGDGASVAVLDTGIDPDHPDVSLVQGGWAEFDENGNQLDSNPYDPDGHGTHVSGTVAGGQASQLDGVPHLGVAPGVDLYNVKVLDNGGTFTQILAGVEWAVEQGIDIINMSLGATGTYDQMIEPLQNAFREGTVVVSSAGNSGVETSGSPANVFETFAIGASDSTGGVASFSSGELIRTNEDWDASWLTEDWPLNYYVPDVSAPGVSVISTYPGGSYRRLSGTSMAAPHVAGAVALVISAQPELRGDVDAIYEIFESTAIHGDGPDAFPDPRYGSGIIDALSTVTAATDNNSIRGTVTDDAGEPLAGVRVQSTFGTSTQTAEDGTYSLLVTDGEWEITADPFGFQPTQETVQVSGAAMVTQDLTLPAGLDVSLTAGQPDVVGRGEQFSIAVDVANLESIQISVTDSSDLTTEDVAVSIDGTSIPLEEPFVFDEPVTGSVVLTVQVTTDASTGTVGLRHTFSGPGQDLTVETGPSEVMMDPEDGSIGVVQWDQTEEVVMGQTLVPDITVENTGDKTITEALQWWLFDPNGQNVFTADVVTLEAGEQASTQLPIGIPETFVGPGETGLHGWIVGDKTVSIEAEFFGPLFAIGEVTAATQIDRGNTFEITVPFQNAGNLEGSDSINLLFDGVFVDSANISGAVGESGTATLEFDTSRVVRDQYSYSLSGTYDETSGEVWVGPVQAPPAVVGTSRPQDLNGDGLFEDIDGSGEADIFDVQALYNNLDTAAVQENAESYNFSGDDPNEVTVFDVQALFNRIQNMDG